jgi:iron complex outermembrane receptor protein
MLGKEKTYQAWYGVPKDSLKTNRTYNPAGAMYDHSGRLIGYYDNQTDHYDQNYYQLHYAHQFSSSMNLTSTLFYTKGKGYYESYKNNQKFSDYGLDDFIIGNDTITKTNLIRQKWLDNDFYGLNLSFNYDKKKFSLHSGAGWNQYDGDHYGKVIWAEFFRPEDLGKNWYFNNGLKKDLNFFTKGQYQMNEHLSLYLDLQYRHIDYDIEGTHDDLSDLTQTHHYDFFNPKAGIFYKINKANNLFFSIAVANREPSRSDFRDADPGRTVKPERLTDLEMGYTLQHKNILLEAHAFYMYYKDQLVLTGKINNVGTPIRTNVPNSFRTGLELNTSFGITSWLQWSLTGTYSINKIKDFTAYIDDWDHWPQQKEEYLGTTDISFSPAFTGNSILTFYPVKNTEIRFVSRYVSRQYIDNTSNKERSLDPYFVNDLKINYTLKPKWLSSLDLMLSLNNIFNTEYETNAWVYRYIYNGKEYEMNGYFPQAKFNFMAGLRFKF